MEKKQLTSQSSNLSRYEYGVKYTLQRRKAGDTTEIDADTANKLSDVLLSNQEIRFVKIKTNEGVQVINVTDVIGIIPDEHKAKKIVRVIQDGLSDSLTYEQIAESARNHVYSLAVTAGYDRSFTKEMFDYFYELAKDIKKPLKITAKELEADKSGWT